MFHRLLIGMTFLGRLMSYPAAAEQLACKARSEVLQKLSQEFSEKSSAIGVANNGGVVELMTSDNRESCACKDQGAAVGRG